MSVIVLPRLIRYRDAPLYLGMDRNRFDDEVRPHIPEYRMGSIGVAFDRYDLDAWVDDFCVTHRKDKKGVGECKREPQASSKSGRFGTSKNKLEEPAYAKAPAQATSQKPNVISLID